MPPFPRNNPAVTPVPATNMPKLAQPPVRPVPATNMPKLAMPPTRPAPAPLEAQGPMWQWITYQNIKHGDLILMQYLYWKHDSRPLVLVAGKYTKPDERIGGINIHYLTLPYLTGKLRGLMDNQCGSEQFRYKLVQHDPYITQAFRIYKKSGIGKVLRFDCGYASGKLDAVRTLKYNPQEMKAIREMIRQQLQRDVNPTAEQLARQATPAEPGEMPQPIPTGRPATVPGVPATLPPTKA